MARARNIKPSFFKNEILGQEDPMISLLYISLWTLADKAGRLMDIPIRIKAETFPYRENLDVNGYLTVLSRLGFIRRYEVDGFKVIQILTFEKHQNPHHTEKPSELPEYSIELDGCGVTVKEPLNNGYAPADSIKETIKDSYNNQPKKQSVKNDYFDQFWKLYPRHEAKANAQKAWDKIKPDEILFKTIMDGLSGQIKSKWTDPKYIPHPTTWLNGGRWADEVSGHAENESNQVNDEPFVYKPIEKPYEMEGILSPEDRAKMAREAMRKMAGGK